MNLPLGLKRSLKGCRKVVGRVENGFRKVAGRSQNGFSATFFQNVLQTLRKLSK